MEKNGEIKARESYLKGETRQEAMATTGLSVGTISKWYCKFEIDEHTQKAAEKTYRVTQINSIERELFNAISIGYDKKIIDELQITYVNFKI